VFVQELPQPFATDDDDPVRVVGQVIGEFADAPPGERSPELHRAGVGRRDDERSSSGLIWRGRPPAH
jgi:hypothetical protein